MEGEVEGGVEGEVEGEVEGGVEGGVEGEVEGEVKVSTSSSSPSCTEPLPPVLRCRFRRACANSYSRSDHAGVSAWRSRGFAARDDDARSAAASSPASVGVASRSTTGGSGGVWA